MSKHFLVLSILAMGAIVTTLSVKTLANPSESTKVGIGTQVVSDARARGEYEIPVVFGLTYHEAREVLITSGWMPLMQGSLYPQREVSLGSGNGKIFWDLGYWEVVSCSGTGAGFCRFEFTDPSGRKLIVISAGMEDPAGSYQAVVRNVQLDNENN